jgi:hypothetical protein
MGIRVIGMEEDVRSLSEVTVKTINPLNLIRRAIEKIPENYPTTPYTCDGFYRLTGKKGLHIIDLSEAVSQVYNETYSRKNKQYKVIRARLGKDRLQFDKDIFIILLSNHSDFPRFDMSDLILNELN